VPTPGAAVPAQRTNPRSSVRAARFAKRKTLRQITTIERHHCCGRYPLKNGRVQVRLAGEDYPVAHYSRVQLCGHIWTCPVCSPRIRQVRAGDVDQAATTWLAHHGSGSVLLLTLTLPHDAGEQLTLVLGAVRRAFSALVAGRAWQEDKKSYQLAHYIRAHDFTVGTNGWHPHVHLLLFAGAELTAEQLSALKLRLFTRWGAAVQELDRRAPSWEHGVTLEAARNRKDVTRYVCQVVTDQDGQDGPDVAMEVARGDLKSSRHYGQRTPWQLLEDYAATRTQRDRGLWREYEKATRGVKAMRWSNGLRAAVGLGEERTDQQIVMEEIGGQVLYEFSPREWKGFRDARGFFGPSAAAELLERAELAGAAGIRAYLAELDQRDAIDRLDRLLYFGPMPGSRSRAPLAA
jgi:hypothetical protein